jgi:hypothetical protein
LLRLLALEGLIERLQRCVVSIHCGCGDVAYLLDAEKGDLHACSERESWECEPPVIEPMSTVAKDKEDQSAKGNHHAKRNADSIVIEHFGVVGKENAYCQSDDTEWEDVGSRQDR